MHLKLLHPDLALWYKKDAAVHDVQGRAEELGLFSVAKAEMGFNGCLSLPKRWIQRVIHRGALQKDERKHSQVARRENLNRGNKLFSMKVF